MRGTARRSRELGHSLWLLQCRISSGLQIAQVGEDAFLPLLDIGHGPTESLEPEVEGSNCEGRESAGESGSRISNDTGGEGRVLQQCARHQVSQGSQGSDVKLDALADLRTQRIQSHEQAERAGQRRSTCSGRNRGPWCPSAQLICTRTRGGEEDGGGGGPKEGREGTHRCRSR